MPWFSLVEARNYSLGPAFLQLQADPYNAPVYNNVQLAGPNNCGGGISRYCISNDDPQDFSDSIAMRDMGFQCYNRAIVWARLGDPADLAKVIEILEYWMINPSTMMDPILTTNTGSIGQHVVMPAFYAAFNLVKDEPSFTSKAAIVQWIDDFCATSWAFRLQETYSNKVDWLNLNVIAGSAVTGNTNLFDLAHVYQEELLNNRFLPDGRVKDDWSRTTGLSYSSFALEAMCLSCEVIYRQTGANLFAEPPMRFVLDFYSQYALNPASWPYQQIVPYTLAENRQYELANTRDPHPVYAQIVALATPIYVDTAGGHITLTNSAASVLNLPVVSDIEISVQNGASGVEAIISWSTDVPTTGTVTWGVVAAENEPPVASPVLGVNHLAILPAITEGVLYYFTIEAVTDLNVTITSSQSSFVAEIDNPPVPGTYSDEFNLTVADPQWVFTDPVGDSTLTQLVTSALISVPAGTAHDAWDGGNNSARIMHLLPDEDFYMEFKIDSSVTQRFQSQGFLIETADPVTFLRFDFYSDGSNVIVHAGTIINDVATSVVNTIITSGTTMYMRVNRTGDLWEQSYSYNGANWVDAGSFTQPMVVVNAGLFAGNVGDNPAHTASFDYYRINQLPIAAIDILGNLNTTLADSSLSSQGLVGDNVEGIDVATHAVARLSAKGLLVTTNSNVGT